MSTNLLAQFILVIVFAFALPAVRLFVRAWTWLYTSVAPAVERGPRRAEVLSDLHEHIEDSKAEGHSPAEIAIHVLLRTFCGLKDDLTWSVPYLPHAMTERLESGSHTLSRLRTPTVVVTSLALFGMVNVLFLMSDGDKPWTALLGWNIAACVVSIVMHNQERIWARRILHWYLALATVLLAGVLIWATLQHRLYEMPNFSHLMLQVPVAMLPPVLAMLVSTERCRTLLFKGCWWPVFACWGLIVAISLGTAIFMGLTTLITVWAAIAMVGLTLAIASAIFVGSAAVICHGGLKGGAGLMRLMAAAAKRMT